MHGCLLSIAATDVPVLDHHAISIHRTDKNIFIVLDQFHA